MNLNELKEKLIKAGALARLSDLDKERNVLLKLLGKESNNGHKAKEVLKGIKAIKVSNKKKHWTQTKYGRRKMHEIMLARHAAKNSKVKVKE